MKRAVLGLIGVLMLAGCAASKAPEDKRRLVETVIVAPEPVAKASLTGEIRARIEGDLSFRIPGKVTARFVEAGQVVHRGEALAQLDPTDFSLASKAARDQVAAARAEARRTRDDLKRIATLVQRGFATARSLDTARAEAESAAARLRASQANAQTASNQRDYATLYADADGIVMSIAAEPGEVVTAGTPIVRLARTGDRDAVVMVPENMRTQAVRSPAFVTLYGSKTRYAATLRSLAAAADRDTRTFEARYAIAGGDRLPLGATATVVLQKASASTLAVPLSSLHDPGTGPAVWVVDRGGRVRLTPVRVTALGDETALLTKGVRRGDRIVSLGVHLLREGEVVRFRSVPTLAYGAN